MNATTVINMIEAPISTVRSVFVGALPDILLVGVVVSLSFMLGMWLDKAMSDGDGWPKGIPRKWPKYNQQYNKWYWD